MNIMEIFITLILVYASALLVDIYYRTVQVNDDKDHSPITYSQIAIKSLITTLLLAMFLFGYEFGINKSQNSGSAQ